MAHSENYYPMPQDAVVTMRKADVLSGEFRGAVPPETSRYLRSLGLADEAHLTERGAVVRSWLMCGASCAPKEVARLLGV